jgi:integrase
MEWLEHLEARGSRPDEPIFPATVGEIGYVKPSIGSGFVGNVLWGNSAGARKVFQKRCMEAGVPYFHPHSFRHLVVSVMAKIPLTEEQKRAFSITLGHANVATTFGSYCSRNMSNEEAVKIVQQIKAFQAKEGVGNSVFTNEDQVAVERLLEKMKAAGIPTIPGLTG